MLPLGYFSRQFFSSSPASAILSMSMSTDSAATSATLPAMIDCACCPEGPCTVSTSTAWPVCALWRSAKSALNALYNSRVGS
jgi:hypothetical protein